VQGGVAPLGRFVRVSCLWRHDQIMGWWRSDVVGNIHVLQCGFYVGCLCTTAEWLLSK
jgi:hypothetical protein